MLRLGKVSMLFVALTVVTALGACGSDAKSTTSSASTSSASSSSAPLTGSVTVFAAASLTEAFNAEKATLEAANPGFLVTYSFGGSGALVQQVTQGAPADIIATADTASMQKLVDAGLVEPPATFARNKLEILVQPGNPKHIMSISDLARSDVSFVTEDDSVPAGKYATAMFKAAGITPSPVSKELDVKSAVAKVTSGEADATVVYVTDVKAAGSKGVGVEIPDAQNQIATYPIAIVKATAHHVTAAALVAAIVAGTGQDALRARGFLPPA